ncbi:ATP-binding cassette domain-containing protein [Desulfobacterales bacterium HSG16]|nr:ATP-binding cassette domain-containing protein [Desulfobacterales bacterium HSG16]
MISIENLSKQFGPQELFTNTGFRINARERAGLVGRNGHGKTTLMRIIVGKEQPDTGTLTLPKQYRIGYVRQHLNFTEDTILKEGMKSLPETEKDHHWKVEKILAGLGYSQSDMNRHPSEFSGGYQVRLNLAGVLISEPDLLLLDEPTNYLDITSIRWIERFLVNWPRELILITHDRGFMDKVVTHVVGIHRRKTRKIAGNTEKFYTQIAQDEEIYEKTRLNDERRKKEIELFITRFRAKARLANMVQSRVKTLSKMEKKDKLEMAKNLDFSFKTREFKGKWTIAAKNLSFGYDPAKPLIQHLDIIANPNDRVCVIGKNGKGKTTLLKILADVLKPDEGSVDEHPAMKKGFFEQTNIKTLVDTRTVVEEILYSHEKVDLQAARNICGAMMFTGDAADKKIEVLSGGEKSRVMLGKLLVTPLNLLLLDEPTNHLDMESCDSMLAAIDNFDGAVIMVTHNEMFLHAIATRLIVFDRNRVEVFEGSYADFLEKRGWDEEAPVKETQNDSGASNDSKMTKKELRRLRSEIINERSKKLKPLEIKIKKCENKIDGHENELQTLNQAMQEASEQQDGKKIASLAQSIHTCEAAIEELFESLEEYTEEYDGKNVDYEKRLKELG